MYAQDNILCQFGLINLSFSSLTHFFINSRPFLVGIVSTKILLPPGDNGENLDDEANKKNGINDDLYKFRALNDRAQGTRSQFEKCKYNVLVEWETGEKTHEPLPDLVADDLVTCASYTKVNGISHLDGWKRFKNLAKRDKHDLPSLASPRGEMKSTFSSTSLSKTPTSSTLCFDEPTLEELNQEPTLA